MRGFKKFSDQFFDLQTELMFFGLKWLEWRCFIWMKIVFTIFHSLSIDSAFCWHLVHRLLQFALNSGLCYCRTAPPNFAVFVRCKFFRKLLFTYFLFFLLFNCLQFWIIFKVSREFGRCLGVFFTNWYGQLFIEMYHRFFLCTDCTEQNDKMLLSFFSAYILTKFHRIFCLSELTVLFGAARSALRGKIVR